MRLKFPSAHLRRASEDPRIIFALLAEFLGAALFQLLAAASRGRPLETGLTFAALSYSTKYLSGGHINPAVSLAAAGSGHIDWWRGLLYALVQTAGAIIGALMEAWLLPGAGIGHISPGCFHPFRINRGGLFWLEAISTALFVIAMYTAVIVAPGHGDSSQFVGGLAIFGLMGSAGRFTGGALNPARVFASSLIFKCHWSYTWVYLAAHVVGSIAAMGWAWFVYGKGMFYGGRRPEEMEAMLMYEGPGRGSMGTAPAPAGYAPLGEETGAAYMVTPGTGSAFGQPGIQTVG